MDISVVIPTYNRYEVLQRALASVYSQTHKPKEVIVIDDGSNDETSQIKKLFPQVKYIYQKNTGVSSARNLGIKNSTCNWITFLDSDDEWHKDKLALHVEFHKNNRDILMSYTDEKWIRDGIEVKIPKKFHKFGGDIFEKCLSHCIIAPSAAMMHIDLINRVGLFDESLEVCEDYEMWLRVTCRDKVGLIDEKLITKYGRSDDQLSVKFWGMDRFRVQALEKLLSLELHLEQKNLLRETLVKKYSVLLKGAIKYDKMLDIEEYKIKIERYRFE
ncbi:glycosyltransferase family 2 protein [Candidatus Sulfurimonas baltica]|uniref:Glycosyltransferase family 2 protein n=1 Tax=Candidatus Sulfurimonas baltica TaxID=2740404 RepID=A0A7S7RNP7_9BACT|nr:glycosyltransferase family A protein [Candidatus Sulfurimonas baltica]QOY52663.1 glycosyltransferase family 2 protein [Candidatus Sulfurimonas baltica]